MRYEIEDQPEPTSVETKLRRWDTTVFAAILLCTSIVILLSQWGEEAVDRDVPGWNQKPRTNETYAPAPVDLSDSEDLEERVGYNGPTPLPGVFASPVPRSPKWRKVRDEYFASHPNCAFKGCKCLGPFNVHHLKPFHEFPELELDPSNLVTVCAGGIGPTGEESPNHHLWVAHQGSFRECNENAKSDLAAGRWPDIGLDRYGRHSKPSKTIVAP